MRLQSLLTEALRPNASICSHFASSRNSQQTIALPSHGRGRWLEPSIAHSKGPANGGKSETPVFGPGAVYCNRTATRLGERISWAIGRRICGYPRLVLPKRLALRARSWDEVEVSLWLSSGSCGAMRLRTSRSRGAKCVRRRAISCPKRASPTATARMTLWLPRPDRRP